MTATVAVLGPGAVGGVLAVPLALSGARVICIARSETAAAIAHEGLTLERMGETFNVRPKSVQELREPVDLLLVTVKAPALGDALNLVAQSHEVGLVLPLLNGLEHVDLIRKRLDAPVVVGTIGRLEAFRRDATHVVQTTPSPLVALSSEEPEPLFRAAGIQTRVEPNERALLWEKLARLAPLAAATAITQWSLGELRTDPAWRATLEAALREACDVAAPDGVILNPAAQWEILDTMPASVTTSTARDAAAGRPTELDALVGAVIRAGRRRGVRTPTLERLLADAEERCRAS